MTDKFVFSKLDYSAIEKSTQEIIAAISNDHSLVEMDGLIADSLKHYYLFKEYSDVQLIKAFKSVGGNPYSLLFFLLRNIYPEHHLYYPNAVVERGAPMERQILYSIDDLSIYGMIKLRNDYGNVLIHPETLGDKIHELIEHKEIKFPDYPHFNSKYYVVALDTEKFCSVISEDLINLIDSVPHAFVEIHNDLLLIGLKKNADIDNALVLVDFLDAVAAKSNII